jgi:hypothetical protein
MAAFLAVCCLASQVSAQGPRKGFAVHEWGVFRVNTDAAFANADLRAEWDELPEFVYGSIKGRVVPQHWGATEIRRKPVIFFHAEQALTAKVRVDFPGGQAGVWFPGTANPAVIGLQKQPKASSTLEWNVGVKAAPTGWTPKNQTYLPVPEKHWIGRLREVKADDVYARYGQGEIDVEREKFIYYDGIFPQGKWAKIRVAGDDVAIANQINRPLFDVTVVDRRGEKPRLGRIDILKPGAEERKIEFQTLEAATFAADAGAALLKQLIAAGLHDDEARSLVDLWSKEFFETPGLNLFYRLPQDEYDTRLPLTITPAPEKRIRVGLVAHAHLETDFAQRVLELVKQLDDPRFATRDAASRKMKQIGPAALVELTRIRERKDLSAEVRERLDGLIKTWSAQEAFDQ